MPRNITLCNVGKGNAYLGQQAVSDFRKPEVGAERIAHMHQLGELVCSPARRSIAACKRVDSAGRRSPIHDGIVLLSSAMFGNPKRRRAAACDSKRGGHYMPHDRLRGRGAFGTPAEQIAQARQHAAARRCRAGSGVKTTNKRLLRREGVDQLAGPCPASGRRRCDGAAVGNHARARIAGLLLAAVALGQGLQLAAGRLGVRPGQVAGRAAAGTCTDRQDLALLVRTAFGLADQAGDLAQRVRRSGRRRGHGRRRLGGARRGCGGCRSVGPGSAGRAGQQ